MSLVKILIDKASENLGSSAELARLLGVPRSKITQWKNGHSKCQPDDMTAIAVYAGVNAMNILAIATLEQAKGTAKEKVLQQALGELIRPLEPTLVAGLIGQRGVNTKDTMYIM